MQMTLTTALALLGGVVLLLLALQGWWNTPRGASRRRAQAGLGAAGARIEPWRRPDATAARHARPRCAPAAAQARPAGRADRRHRPAGAGRARHRRVGVLSHLPPSRAAPAPSPS
jgi:hypothetical protein